MTVKAYGGRRWTAAKQVVLAKHQKTRGRFYLFLLYEVNQARLHWRYMAGKSAQEVCQFMRQVRRWYPEEEVGRALDQDPAHPCKSPKTRRVMRELRLHWRSFPKRSPADNPVETIFRDGQMMILDNSDDSDVQATQQRISAHLRGRNRRKDRHIPIKYLLDSHKN